MGLTDWMVSCLLGTQGFILEKSLPSFRERETQDSLVTDVQDTGNLQFKVGEGDIPALDIQTPTEKRKVLVFCTWLH